MKTSPALAAAARPAVHATLVPGLLAAALSAGVLAWRGRTDSGSAAAPLNAVSHILWGDEAMHRDDVSAEYTLLGGALHASSALFWAAIFGWVRRQRSANTVAGAVTDAAAVTLLAAVVDLKLVPKRLTPGFERRLDAPSVAAVFGALGIGLALGGWLASHRSNDGGS